MSIFTNYHLGVGGWNFHITVVLLLTALAAFVFIRNEYKNNMTLDHLLSEGLGRITLGAILVIIGVAIRIGGWLPWRTFKFLEDPIASDTYLAYSIIWTSTGVILATLGLAIAVWPVLARWSLKTWEVFWPKSFHPILHKYQVYFILIEVLLLSFCNWMLGAWLTSVTGDPLRSILLGV